MQPYLFPYLGYFQLINAVDKYVVYDDVNYIKGGWVNRNNILLNGQKHLFSITLDKASVNKCFNEILIKDDFKKFKEKLRHAYSKAPYYNSVINLIEQIINYDDYILSNFVHNMINVICNYLDIETTTILSSSIEKNNQLKGEDKVIEICKQLGASKYYNAIGGIELYNKDTFKVNGIDLFFINTLPYKYNQNLKNDSFVSNLSIIDVLMFNNKEEIHSLLNRYELV